MSDPIRWFRVYGEAVDDEKLRLLAFEDRWHFIAILCCKAQGLLNADDPLMRRKVAIKLGLADRELDEVTRRLAEVGLIDLQTFAPLAWDRRQFKGDQDSTSAERQRRYRETQKSVTGVSRVTEPLRNGHVTRPETETETDNTPLTPLPGGGKPKRERKPRTSLQTFVDRCKASGEKPISDYRPLQEYVKATGLPMEFVQLCWQVFKVEFLPPGSKAARLQADWRRHFLNFVEKGYYRLWYAKADGSFELTTAGVQARSFHNREAA